MLCCTLSYFTLLYSIHPILPHLQRWQDAIWGSLRYFKSPSHSCVSVRCGGYGCVCLFVLKSNFMLCAWSGFRAFLVWFVCVRIFTGHSNCAPMKLRSFSVSTVPYHTIPFTHFPFITCCKLKLSALFFVKNVAINTNRHAITIYIQMQATFHYFFRTALSNSK